MTRIEKYKTFELSTDKTRINLETVHAFLSGSYWAAGIPKELVAKSIKHSLTFSAYTGADQVAFARVITDQATFAYLADVFVLPEHRDAGLGKALMQFIMTDPNLQGLRRFLLATKDAHGLYAQFGFTPLSHPDALMEINRQDTYRAAKER